MVQRRMLKLLDQRKETEFQWLQDPMKQGKSVLSSFCLTESSHLRSAYQLIHVHFTVPIDPLTVSHTAASG
jgi:hypothetical protein